MTTFTHETISPHIMERLHGELERYEWELPKDTAVRDLNPAIIAMNGLSLWPEAMAPMHRLRADVYITSRQYLTESARHDDGGEYDADDHRAVHIAVVGSESRFEPTILGCIRLIEKRDNPAPLPVERHFDLGEALPADSIEVSRFIAEHADKRIQSQVSTRLIAAFLAYAGLRGLKPYAILERGLQRHLRNNMALHMDEIAPPKFVAEYNTVNLAVLIDPWKTYEAAMQRFNPLADDPGPLPAYCEALRRMDFGTAYRRGGL